MRVGVGGFRVHVMQQQKLWPLRPAFDQTGKYKLYEMQFTLCYLLTCIRIQKQTSVWWLPTNEEW